MTKYIDPETKKSTTKAALLKKIKAAKKEISLMKTQSGFLAANIRLAAFELAAGLRTSAGDKLALYGEDVNLSTASIDSKGVVSVDMVKRKLVKLKISHGEFVFDSFFIITGKEKADDVAKYFYDDNGGEKGKKDLEDGYFFNGGEIHVDVVWEKDITSSQYETLKSLGIA